MSTLKVNTLTDTAATKSVPIEDVVNGTARAWVNFNGTGTVAINAQYNVASITDNGTGNYTVNFTTAMPDANYAVGCSQTTAGGSSATSAIRLDTFTTTSFDIISRNGSAGAFFDQAYVGASVFR